MGSSPIPPTSIPGSHSSLAYTNLSPGLSGVAVVWLWVWLLLPSHCRCRSHGEASVSFFFLSLFFSLRGAIPAPAMYGAVY